MLSVRQFFVPILALPRWITVFFVIIPVIVFISPSWLPEPDAQYQLTDVYFTYPEETNDPAITREIREPISLPHDWGKSGPLNESGWYEFFIHFDKPADESFMLYISHVQQQANIWIDDFPVNSNVPEYVVGGHIWSKPIFLRLPKNALDAGNHRIAIHVESEPVKNALLGNVYLGPEQQLRPYWEWRYHYRFTLVAIVTFGMLSLSLVMGLLWLLRKKDTMYGWFTICTFFWSLHNIPHIIDTPRNVTPATWDAVYFILLGWMVMTLAIFNHRYTGSIYPKREKFLLIYGLVGALPFIFLSQENLHNYAYWFWDLSLLPLGAYMIYYLTQAHYRKPDLGVKLLILAGTVIFSFGLHDYFVVSGLIDRTQGLLIQFSGFPTMLVLIWFLLSRFVKVLAESESLNLELEQRVHAKEVELENNFEQLKKMEQEQLLSDERGRIMQDVHDGVGGQLVAMLAEIETGKISQNEVRDALSQSLTDLRLVIDSLDVASEDLPTLLGMLRSRLQPRLDGHDIELQWGVQALPALDDFGPRKALQLMRILQEIFVNILKHSNAKNIYLDTRVLQNEDSADQIEIVIRDDGHWQKPVDNFGHGLKNMQRRADSIGAELEIDGQDKGTSVKIILSNVKSD